MLYTAINEADEGWTVAGDEPDDYFLDYDTSQGLLYGERGNKAPYEKPTGGTIYQATQNGSMINPYRLLTDGLYTVANGTLSNGTPNQGFGLMITNCMVVTIVRLKIGLREP